MKETPDIVPYSQWLTEFTDDEINEFVNDKYSWRDSQWYSASELERIDITMRKVYNRYVKRDIDKYNKWLNQ